MSAEPVPSTGPRTFKGHLTYRAVAVTPEAKCAVRTHAQSNSDARLSLACKAGKTQSYFSNQNGDTVTGARSGASRGRAPSPAEHRAMRQSARLPPLNHLNHQAQAQGLNIKSIYARHWEGGSLTLYAILTVQRFSVIS